MSLVAASTPRPYARRAENEFPRAVLPSHLCASTILLCLFCSLSRGLGATGTLEDVIENVAANEELYREIEVVYRSTYKDARDQIPHPPSLNPTRTADRTGRYVFQSSLIYFKESADQQSGDGAREELTIEHGYDGEVTRMVEIGGPNAANIHQGRVHDPRIPLLNTFFYRRWNCLSQSRTRWFLLAVINIGAILAIVVIYAVRKRMLRSAT